MDFASLKDSGAKNLMEMLAHDISRTTSRSEAARGITSLLQRHTGSPAMTRGLLSASRFILPTIINVENLPQFVTSAFNSVGFDGQTANKIVNETLDSVLRGIPQEMLDNLSEDELNQRLRGKLTELTGEGGKLHDQFKKLTTTPADEAKATEVFLLTETTSNTERTTLHHATCHRCLRIAGQRPTRGRQNATPSPSVQLLKLGDYLHIEATTDDCCREKIAQLTKIARSRKVTLTEMLQSLPAEFHTAREQFFTAMASAPPEQTDLLNELEAIRAWEAEDGKATVGALLLQYNRPTGFNRVGFLRRIKAIAKPEKPSGESQAVSAVTDFFSEVHRTLGGAVTEIEDTERAFTNRSNILKRIGR